MRISKIRPDLGKVGEDADWSHSERNRSTFSGHNGNVPWKESHPEAGKFFQILAEKVKGDKE
jgi:hypothetical protein